MWRCSFWSGRAVSLLRTCASWPSRWRALFTFTVLDRSNTLSIVKGDNPFCLYHYPREGLYLYASTEAILQQALRRMPGKFGLRQMISVACGEILKIAADGTLTRSRI